MAKAGKKYREASSKIERRDSTRHSRRLPSPTSSRVRSSTRPSSPFPAGRRYASGRSAGSRLGLAAERHRQRGPRRRVRRGRQGARGRGRRRRRGRRGRSRRQKPGRLVRFRRRSGNTRPDGQGRQGRQAARPARPQPNRSSAPSRWMPRRPSASSRRDALSTAPTSSVSPTWRSAASFEPQALVENYGAFLDEIPRARPASSQGQVHQDDHRHDHDGARHQGRPQRRTKPARSVRSSAPLLDSDRRCVQMMASR